MGVALSLALAACRPATPPASLTAPERESRVPTSLPDGPLAPELTNQTWLNSERLTSADLRGRVVLIDFWTFG
jgi:hypothetical protein